MAETRGAPLKCFVIASTKVRTLEMSMAVGQEEFRNGTFLQEGWRNTAIKQQFGGDMAMGVGDTFQEAMMDLFANWTPDGGKAAIESGEPDDDDVIDAEIVSACGDPTCDNGFVVVEGQRKRCLEFKTDHHTPILGM